MSNDRRWNAGGNDGWGVAPPYGAYRGHYGGYAEGQTGTMGSGQLGGWSSVNLGGSFEDEPPANDQKGAAPELEIVDEDEVEFP
jgi:hypothetical protein